MANIAETIADEDLRALIVVKKETRSNQYIADCPFCQKAEHFYINRITQRWDCKKCGEQGGIRKLLRHLDKTYLLGAPTVKNNPTIKSIREIQDEVGDTETITNEPLKTIHMPAGFRVFDKPTEYLSERGINMEDIRHWRFGCTRIVSRLIGYVIIPITEDGEVKGYIGRYGKKKVPENRLRYSNSLGTDFGRLLFGYDDVIKDKIDTVIITEGLFDAIAVTKKLDLFSDDQIRAVCTFGKKISRDQIQKLLDKNVRQVVLLYDYDALKEIRHYATVLDEYFVTKVAVALGKKDIDECTADEVLEVFNNLKSVQNFNRDILPKMKR